MENGRIGSDQSQDPVKVWTFRIQGGEAFDISLPANPALNHDGGRTLWKLLGPKELADAAASLIRAMGAEVEVFSEEQTPEQLEERQRLLEGIEN